MIPIQLSNPNPTDKSKSYNYSNVNILGMYFLRKFKTFKLEGCYTNNDVNLELIQHKWLFAFYKNKLKEIVNTFYKI